MPTYEGREEVVKGMLKLFKRVIVFKKRDEMITYVYPVLC